MKAVLMSIRPEWCELIANGKKTIEVRKTRSTLQTPFKVYIYCTNGTDRLLYRDTLFDCYMTTKMKYRKNIKKNHIIGSGKVIGEFVCDRIDEYIPFEAIEIVSKYEKSIPLLKESCLTLEELGGYIGNNNADKNFYGWHISDLKIYDKPKELSEFFTPMEKRPSYMIERPPQSWCYVEE